MKNIKRLTALVLAMLVVFALAGCHGKDEIAATAGDTTFTSAFYMCALIDADMEARSKVDEAKAEANKDTSSATSSTVEETDYYAEKIDGKTFAQWVKDAAINRLQKFAFLDAKVKEFEIKVDEEEVKNLESYAEYYWVNYGYQALYEVNGVALSTYKKYMAYTAKENAYFDYIYGKGGTKEIAAADISKFLSENYVIADVLEGTTSNIQEDKDKNEYITKFKGYADRLKKGENFKKVYNEFNGIKEDTSSTASTTSDKDELKAKDELAKVIGKEGTSYANSNFDVVKAMKIGEIKEYTPRDSTNMYVFIKGDIMADPYYISELDDTIRYDMKHEEFEKAFKEDYAKQQVETIAYAIDRFKVEKIKYPEA